MSSTSRPQTTGTSNIQPGQTQSPTKQTSQVESTTNPPQNVAQPSLYQNNANQQFIPSQHNNIPLINSAQQLQFQTNFHQHAAFLQRQTQLLHQQQQQQQQQPNSVESQLKNQQLANGPLAGFPNFPDLINLLLLQSNSNLNFPLSQLNQAMSPVPQQPLQTPKTLPVSPSKLGPSHHTPRSAVTTNPKSVTANINNAQTAEVNSTSTTLSVTVAEQHNEPLKPAMTSPAKSIVASTISTPSSINSDRAVDEVKERTNASGLAISKTVRDESALNNSVTPPNDIVQDTVPSPEANKSLLPRRKQTATGVSPIKVNPVISPSNPTGPVDSLSFSTPKKSNDVSASTNSNVPVQVTPPVASIAVTPTTPTTPNNPPDKKVKQTNKEVAVSKSVKKNELEPKADDQKPTPVQGNSSAQGSSKAQGISSAQEPAKTEAKSKRNRFKTNLFQCPTPDLVLATRMSREAYKNSSTSKDKLVIFYNDEFLAVRNDEGSFFLCQCLQNMYRASKKCRVRWLNKVLNSDDTYELAFYDQIDKECILTTVALDSAANNNYILTSKEQERIDNILKKSIDVEKGLLPKPEVTEENPDGLDISLYKSESQLELKESVSPSLKRPAESTPKSVPTTKKAKKSAKASSSRPTPKRRRKNSSSAESQQKSEKSTNQSKNKNLTPRSRRSNELDKVKSPSIGPKSSTSDNSTESSRPNDDSNSDAGKKKVAKAKKQNKSTGSAKDSPSTSGQQRTLRARSKN